MRILGGNTAYRVSILTGEQTLGYLVNLKHAQHMIPYRERLDVGGMVVTKGGMGDQFTTFVQPDLVTHVMNLSLVTWCCVLTSNDRTWSGNKNKVLTRQKALVAYVPFALPLVMKVISAVFRNIFRGGGGGQV